MFQPVENQRVYIRVIDQIRRALSDGVFVPGDRLPSERELATTFAVSRASIRQAISALEAVGTIEVRKGDGIYVSEYSDEEFVDTLERYFVAQRITASEILEARNVVECANARRSATRATEEQRRNLRRLVVAEAEAADSRDRSSLLAIDRELHNAIAESTGNRGMVRIMGLIELMMDVDVRSELLRFEDAAPAAQSILHEQHVVLVNAIIARSPDEAEHAMDQHLRTITARVRESA